MTQPRVAEGNGAGTAEQTGLREKVLFRTENETHNFKKGVDIYIYMDAPTKLVLSHPVDKQRTETFHRHRFQSLLELEALRRR